MSNYAEMSREQLLSLVLELEHYKTEYLKLLQRVAKHNPKRKNKTVAVDLMKDKISKNSINDLFQSARNVSQNSNQSDSTEEKGTSTDSGNKRYPSAVGSTEKKYPSTVASKKYPSTVKRD